MAFQIVRKLADGVLDPWLARYRRLLKQLLLVGLGLALGSLGTLKRVNNLFSARIELLERQVYQVLQARDSRNGLLDQVELLGLQVIDARFDLLGLDAVVLLADGDHVGLELVQLLADGLGLLARRGRRRDCQGWRLLSSACGHLRPSIVAGGAPGASAPLLLVQVASLDRGCLFLRVLLNWAGNLLLLGLVRSKGIDLVAGLPGRLHVLLVALLLLVLIIASEVADSRTLVWLDPAWMLSFAAAVARIGHIVAAAPLLEQIVAVLERGRVEALMMVVMVECLPAPMLLRSAV